MKQVSVCIIGGGISGLYCAYKLLHQKQTPKEILLIEKQKQLGGRMAMGVFEGQRVPKAAGIGRFNKDVLLKQLLIELSLPINYYSQQIKNPRKFIKSCLKKLQSNLHTLKRSEETFETYSKRILGKELYKTFVSYIGFSDYEESDVIDALDNYGFDDTYGKKEIFVCDWAKFISVLYKKIKELAIENNCNFEVQKGTVVDYILKDGRVVLLNETIINAHLQ